MDRSQAQSTQVWNGLPLTCGAPEEKGEGIKSRTELWLEGEKSKCLDVDRLGRGRGDTTSGKKDEDVANVPAASGSSCAIR